MLVGEANVKYEARSSEGTKRLMRTRTFVISRKADGKEGCDSEKTL
jgi:hypothetical protein